MALDATIGGASSDSYDTLAAFQTYATSMGWTLTKTDAEQEADLRRATLYLDRTYYWIGYRAASTQARQWPRIISDLVEGYSVLSTTIPDAIISAQFELAWILHGGTDIFATVDVGAIKSSSVAAGPVESSTEYHAPRETPWFTSIEGLIAPYKTSKRAGGGFSSVPLVRG